MFCCALIIVTIFSIAPPASGAVFDDTPDQVPESPWSATLETGFIYDDNVFQEKEARTSDTVWTSRILLGYLQGEVFVSALALMDRYRDNTVLNTDFYEIGIEGPLGRRNYGSLFLNLTPTAPLDKADTGPPFELASRGLNLLLDHELSRGRIGFSFAFTRLDYNDAFNAKDSDITALGPTGFYIFSEDWTISGEAAFERGRAAGGFVGDRRDDISYRATVLSFQTRYHFSPRVNFRLKYDLRRKRFTTQTDDPLHAGRLDQNQRFRIENEWRPTPTIALRAGFEAVNLRSSRPVFAFASRRWLFSASYVF